MSAKLWISGVSLLLLALTFGCNEYMPKDASNVPASANEQMPKRISFSFVRTQVLQPYCIRCHSNAGGNPKGVNLETYPNVIRDLSRVENETLIEHSMPPKATLPAYAQKCLETWVSLGAHEEEVDVPNGGGDEPYPSPSPGVPPSPTPIPTPIPVGDIQPTWDSISANLFAPVCNRCHGAGDHVSGKVNLTIKSWVLDPANKVVIPGNSKDSLLYRAVTGDGVKRMPPKSAPLEPRVVDVIKTWIDNGAKD